LEKYFNILLLYLSWLASVVTKKAFLWGFPPSIGVEISSHCNLSCPECATGSGNLNREKGFMEPGTFRKIVDELKPFLFNINLYFQGEPMLNPGFFDFAAIAGGIGMTLSTNGHFITENSAAKLINSGIRKIIIPLDGMDQDTYGRYRLGGDIERVKEGIRILSEAKKNAHSGLTLEIQFLVNKYNYHQIDKARRFALSSGFRFRLKSMQIISGDYEKWLPPGNEFKRFRRYVKRNGKYVSGLTPENRCLRLWMNPVITWDGKVLPCCFDKSGEFSFGKLGEESFTRIWKGEKSMSFRNRFLSHRSGIKICMNCTTGLKNVSV